MDKLTAAFEAADVDADLASLALSTMVSRSAYVTFALGQGPADIGQLAATLTRLWVNALRIPAAKDAKDAKE